MRLRLFTWALLLAVSQTAGCATQEAASDTEDLTRSMLAAPVDDGMSNSVPQTGVGGGSNEGPQIPVVEIGYDRGAVEAPVKVIEMSDYGCGYCRQFHQETFPTLLTEFIESGMVEWKFAPYITGMFDNSLVATEAAECTYAQDRAAFEVLNSRLWDDQAGWKRSSEPESVVRSWVADLGVDMGAFDTCLEEDTHIDRVAAATALARQIGVRGTPTFIVIGYPPLQGALPLQTFRDVLTAVHAQAISGAGH